MNSHEQQQQFQPNTQIGSGLTRYRSAPSSYFNSLLSTPSSDGGGFGADDFEQLFNPRTSSPETQITFSRFMDSSTAAVHQHRPPIAPPQPQLLPPAKLEAEEYRQPQQLQSNDYSSAAMYSEAGAAVATTAAGTSYTKAFASFNSNCKIERGGAASSGLIRHTSSPAGFFANFDIENELDTRRGVGSYGGGNSANVEAPFASANRFMSQMDYSSSHNSLGMINPISEDAAVEEDHGNDVDYLAGLPWDDSALLSDPYLKGLADDQKNEAGNRHTTLLSHHLSLPKSSMEKLLQESVPCKIRAKRGCATHPRSIAERVRRTKISERMRKLQELVPNMEKQTNTSDMLDLAVDYIKDLQRQLKIIKPSAPARVNNDVRSNGYELFKMIKEQRPLRIM